MTPRASQAPARTCRAASSTTVTVTQAYGGRPARPAMTLAVAPTGCPSSASAQSGTAQPRIAPATAGSTTPRAPARPTAPAARPTRNGTHHAPSQEPIAVAAAATTSAASRSGLLAIEPPGSRAGRAAGSRDRQGLGVPPERRQVRGPGRGRVLRLPAWIHALGGDASGAERGDHPPAWPGGGVEPSVGGV